ncbi:DUF309 domain-containing protein [Caminibacter mediatlanticus TB-2]|uniref:DUF309 domain-containing protein n=1 Tax=Caminibacter mediatlanticus TB-2 TaxID=391592 RepID=A0AAI9AHT5_9BACT|nr:DUF309 domain-containing protein [Caminibacter mediatlanticus]EDM24461.1 hypothetical protein CMTB2_03058 [Caminibacter mediatlanticus TB-2]QCT95110.1 DUF309 domain-containing protein [Caminibacter mediatlanticus TB-2]
MANFELFKELIKEGKYYDAHEVLEEYWHTIRKTDHPYKNAYRGFINAAVALELKKRGRDCYKRVWMTYEKYKFLYKQKSEFIEIMKFLDRYKPF